MLPSVNSMDEIKTNWHTGIGTIIYDPYRAQMKNNRKNWAILNVDREITRYYRWWVQKNNWIELCQPSWDAHVSIIRGEYLTPRVQHLWKKYDRKKIQFSYNHNVIRAGQFWVLNVTCGFLKTMRQDFNLPFDWNFHLTIGRIWY